MVSLPSSSAPGSYYYSCTHLPLLLSCVVWSSHIYLPQSLVYTSSPPCAKFNFFSSYSKQNHNILIFFKAASGANLTILPPQRYDCYVRTENLCWYLQNVTLPSVTFLLHCIAYLAYIIYTYNFHSCWIILGQSSAPLWYTTCSNLHNGKAYHVYLLHCSKYINESCIMQSRKPLASSALDMFDYNKI